MDDSSHVARACLSLSVPKYTVFELSADFKTDYCIIGPQICATVTHRSDNVGDKKSKKQWQGRP